MFEMLQKILEISQSPDLQQTIVSSPLSITFCFYKLFNFHLLLACLMRGLWIIGYSINWEINTMIALAQIISSNEVPVKERTTIKTCLYDLIEAIGEEINPGEENLIGLTLQHIFNSDEFIVRGNPRFFQNFC